MNDINEVLAKLSADTRKHVGLGTDTINEKQRTPSIGLNLGLNGGLGYGRIATIHGSKSSGKSTMCLQMIADAQRNNKACAWVDAEKAFDQDWATRLGVDTDNLLVTRANDMYRAGDEIVDLIKAGIDLIVVDSISALIQPSYLDKTGEFAGMEKTAKIGDFSKGIKALIRSINLENDKALIVLISQQTTEINATYIRKRPEGGLAIEYYSSQVVKLSSTNSKNNIINGEVYIGDRVLEKPIGRKVTWEVEFNKLGPQGEMGAYELYFRGDQVGVDNKKELVTLAVETGLVQKGGAWYTYYSESAEEHKFQGERQFTEALEDNADLYEELLKRVELAI